MNPRGSIITVSDLHRMLYDEDMKPGAMPLSILSKITNNFSEELIIGSGGFAEVYKGIVENDLVAVKKLTEESMDEKEYKRELECLLSVRHKNIVRFLGYCGDTQWDMRRKKGEIIKSNKEKRLLCFEYVPNGTLDGCIKDPSTGLAWRNRYEIIKGICEGLSYLHQINILHLDLKPGNILLGENEVPKITDFGLSRYFREDKAYVTATKEVGTMGYMAPEYTSKQITKKFDLYSLGVLIIEIITGKKGYQAVHEVLESWINRLDISQRNSEWEQIKVCTEIGIQCIDSDPANRPDSMKDIMDRLTEMESVHVIPAAGGQSQLLDVHPPVLYFPFESNKVIPCSLHLTNNTNEQVAFRLMDRGNKSGPGFVRLPLCGLVPPRSTYTLVVTTEERNELERRNICMILKITILGDEHIDKFQSGTLLEEMGNEVQEVKLIGVHTTRQEIMPSKLPMSPKIKILDIGKWYHQSLGQKCYEMQSFDTNHAKQWIITGGSQGHVGIWNYQAHKKVDSLRLSMYEDVICVKFIARRQCFVAMTEIGVIHVYNYEPKIRKITIMSAGYVHPYWRRINKNGVLSLAVHPTKPYLLSVSGIEIKLWDGDKGWECTQIFKVLGSRSGPCPVAFNRMDIIAIASDVNKVEIRNLDSPKNDYILSGHSDEVNCLHFFTSGDQEYLVTGSDDKTAKIWDMEKKLCVYTLGSLGSPAISAIVYQPNLQILMTGSNDGLIYLWSTTNSRICSRSPTLERIIDVRYGGALHGLACWMGRVVIEKKDAVAVLDVENKDYQEESMEYIEALLTEHTTSKVMELLDIHPLELLFHRKPHNIRSLHLTNKSDEHVVFRVAKVVDDEDSDSWDYLLLYGTVHPRSTCRLIVITDQDNEIATEMDIVVQSSILGDKNMVLLARPSECHEFFDQAKELGHVVHEVPLKFVYTPTQQETMFEPVIAPTTTITSWWMNKDVNMPLKNTKDGRLQCLDAHPTEPWIVTGHCNGDACMWNCDTQELLVHTLFKISDEPVMSVKFDARQRWIVAQTHDGLIHVYDCVCVTQIKKMASFGDLDSKPIQYSIAVNPIKPYVLSSSESLMNLWDGDKGWECTQTFGSKSSQSFDRDDPPKSKCQAFNPEDPNSFANLSVNEIVMLGSFRDPMIDVQVWSLDSSEPNYRLSGHLETVNCLAYFTRADRQYLITGSDDCTAKIWDLQQKACIHTLEGFMSQVVHVISVPGRPYLVTCSRHGTIQVWSSIDFRLKTTADFSGGEYVRGLACLMGSRRIVIGRGYSISIMDIDVEEEAVTSDVEEEAVTPKIIK